MPASKPAFFLVSFIFARSISPSVAMVAWKPGRLCIVASMFPMGLVSGAETQLSVPLIKSNRGDKQTSKGIGHVGHGSSEKMEVSIGSHGMLSPVVGRNSTLAIDFRDSMSTHYYNSDNEIGQDPNVQTWTKTLSTKCGNDLRRRRRRQKYGNLQKAQNDCAKDLNCKGLYDVNCDGGYYKCDVEWVYSSSSCVYERPANCSTLTEIECGVGYTKDTTKNDLDCTANPCTTGDAQTCCKQQTCLTQQCLECASTPFKCARCDASTTLSITGDCLGACPPGEYESSTTIGGVLERTCSLCNGEARRRRAHSCEYCQDGYISQSQNGKDECVNIQSTCGLAQCQECQTCFQDGQNALQGCMAAKAPTSTCINFNEVWCGTYMSIMEQCEGFSLGCYFLLMCHSPCVCQEWKQVRCGGSFTTGSCTPTLLEEFSRELIEATQTTGIETSYALGSTPSVPHGNSDFPGNSTGGAGSAEAAHKSSAVVSLMRRQSSNETEEESSLDEALEDKCSSLSR